MGSGKWPLQEAKNKLSELVRRAQKERPQVITLRGHDAVVVVSAEDFKKFSRPKEGFVDFFRKSPLFGVELDLARSRDTGRDIAL